MDGEANGSQETQQDAQEQNEAQEHGSEQGQQAQQGVREVSAGADYERQIAERDERIKELEAQVAKAAESAEAAEKLRGEIEELKAQGENDRIDFKLQLAGCRNVKAARAILADHGNDIDKLKRPSRGFSPSTPQTRARPARPGFPTLAPRPTRKVMKRWRRIAGLEDEQSTATTLRPRREILRLARDGEPER